jgi:hypothetical protein
MRKLLGYADDGVTLILGGAILLMFFASTAVIGWWLISLVV